MRSRQLAWICCVAAVTLGISQGQAQNSAETIQPEAADELRAMSRMAGIIFGGRVVAIRRDEAVVEIDFEVEQPVRGVSGGVYTLREWAGLWAAANEPLRLGQRYLMLLHAPGAAGLSSPVGGADGAIPILSGGDAVAQGAAMAAAGPGVTHDARAIDLRWVAARSTRQVVYGAEVSEPAATSATRVQTKSRAAQLDVTPTASAEVDSHGRVSYAAVLGVIRGWEKADAAR